MLKKKKRLPLTCVYSKIVFQKSKNVSWTENNYSNYF